ncbi:MAG: Mur ligase family protein [Chloroflexota bacterium]
MNIPLTLALDRIESLITRPAESYTDPDERAAEFQRRLERTHRLMECLGAPHRTLNTIHIGGTSGKGSVAMLCESVLLEAGLQVGTHTSPYLQSSLEKVRVDGRLLAPQEAVELADEVMTCVEYVRASWPELGAPHYAEAWLGMALSYFQKRRCEVGVIEVGMGGRYDCTNIITPSVSVISTVHYDHMRVLGETIAEIAYHKAGIIKPGIPIVLGEVESEEAVAQIEAEARHRGTRLLRLGKEIQVQPTGFSLAGGSFSYRGLDIQLDDLRVGLLGRHQIANAAVALAALEVFCSTHGITLEEGTIRRGLAKARFAGRLEIMQEADRGARRRTQPGEDGCPGLGDPRSVPLPPPDPGAGHAGDQARRADLAGARRAGRDDRHHLAGGEGQARRPRRRAGLDGPRARHRVGGRHRRPA